MFACVIADIVERFCGAEAIIMGDVGAACVAPPVDGGTCTVWVWCVTACR
jgi:hypothetical protein